MTTAAIAASPLGASLSAALSEILSDETDASLVEARQMLLLSGVIDEQRATDAEPSELPPSLLDLSNFSLLRRQAEHVPMSCLSPWGADGGGSGRGSAFIARVDASGYSFPVACASSIAQLWFNRGMLLAWGFNCDESAKCHPGLNPTSSP